MAIFAGYFFTIITSSIKRALARTRVALLKAYAQIRIAVDFLRKVLTMFSIWRLWVRLWRWLERLEFP